MSSTEELWESTKTWFLTPHPCCGGGGTHSHINCTSSYKLTFKLHQRKEALQNKNNPMTMMLIMGTTAESHDEKKQIPKACPT